MAKRTEKSRYQSDYTDGFVTAAQYVAEKLCERQARTLRMKLPKQFWNTDEHKSYFRAQVTAAAKLIKKYGEQVVINVLARQDVSWCYSASSPAFARACIAEKLKIERAVPVITETIVIPDTPAPIPSTTPSMRKNKIRNLD